MLHKNNSMDAALMQFSIKVRTISQICAVIILVILTVIMPVSADVSPPTVDSVTPSTTSIVNGGTVIITFSGTCGAKITQASFSLKSPQEVGYGTDIQTTTNGNRWTGTATYTFVPNAPSGQYKVGRINIEDAAQNYLSTDFTPEVVINVQNSGVATPPTVDSVTPSTTSIVNGGTVIITFSGTCGAKITQASFSLKSPQEVGYGTDIQTTTNGNRWTGTATYTFVPNAPSGQYKVGRINIEDAAQNYLSTDFTPEVVINVQNSGQTTSTSTITQTASSTTAITTSPITTSIKSKESTTPNATEFTTVKPTQSLPTKISLNAPLQTDLPTQPTPLGIELGIVALCGAAFLIVKRK
jgi:hypothetical protein